MRQRIRIAALILIIAGTGFLAWQFLRSDDEPQEPRYLSKPIGDWLDGYPAWSHGTPDEVAPMANANDEVDAAVREMGTNAIPALFQFLEARDSMRKTLAYFINDHTRYSVRITWTPALLRHYQAVKAFRALGGQASNAVPELIKRSKQSHDRAHQELIAFALGGIGPRASNAVPLLLEAVTNAGSSRVPYNSFRALGQIHANPGKVVPVIITFLKNPDVNVRRMSVRNLQAFGVDARPAVPALIESLADQDEYVRKNAADALKVIDPESAAKAAVK